MWVREAEHIFLEVIFNGTIIEFNKVYCYKELLYNVLLVSLKHLILFLVKLDRIWLRKDAFWVGTIKV